MMQLILSLASLIGITSHNQPECVDMIELNHYYDSSGSRIFDQVIFWDRNRTSGCPEVRSWRMASDNEQYTRRPVKSEVTGMWSSEWVEHGMRYRIVSRQYRESWTQVDPEQIDRKKLPDSERKGLFDGRNMLLQE